MVQLEFDERLHLLAAVGPAARVKHRKSSVQTPDDQLLPPRLPLVRRRGTACRYRCLVEQWADGKCPSVWNDRLKPFLEKNYLINK
jgi:hypothetical protein